MLTGLGGKKGGLSAVLIILLACLCFSRGEGIRLLPFTESPEPSALSATAPHNLVSLPRVSERIDSPIERKADCSLVKNLAKHLVSVDLPSVKDRDSEMPDAIVSVTAISAWHGPSKFGLTSSSDRSPPPPGAQFSPHS